MADRIKILGFAGSLREGSYNKKIVRFALKIAEEQGVETEFLDLRDLNIPPYDADLQEKAFPKGVQEFKNKIRAADAILISSPEYNHASPGVLKNALNWSSRPYGDAAFEGKLVGLMSAAPGRLGGARALIDLRTSLNEMGAWVYPPTVSIPGVSRVLDERENITDPELVEVIKDFLSGLISWAKRFQDLKVSK